MVAKRVGWNKSTPHGLPSKESCLQPTDGNPIPHCVRVAAPLFAAFRSREIGQAFAMFATTAR